MNKFIEMFVVNLVTPKHELLFTKPASWVSILQTNNFWNDIQRCSNSRERDQVCRMAI